MNLLNNIFNTNNSKEIATAFHHDSIRTAMVQAIADLKSERNRELEPLSSQISQAVIAHDKARIAFELAEQNKRAAEQSLNKTRHTFNHQISRVEARLLACVPDSINETIELLKHDLRVLCGQLPPAPVTGFTAKARRQAAARNELIKVMDDRRESLRDGISKCNDLRLKSIDDINNGLAKIRTTLDMPPMASMQ